MKEMIHKITRSIAAIVISCIAVYGIVYAQQACCRTFTETCIPTLEITSNCYYVNTSFGISPSSNPSCQLRSNLSFSNNQVNSASGNTCCKTDRCDGNNQATEFPLSFIQDYSLLQKNAGSLASGIGAQTAAQLYNQSTPHNAVPIYILTKSIIC